MRFNIRTSFFGKILYYLCIATFMLSTGIAMAQGTHEIRTPYNHSFELEGNTIPQQNLWPGYPLGFDDFDEVYLDIVANTPATPTPPGFAAGTVPAAEWWGGGVLYKEPTEGLTNAYIEAFIWDDFREFTDLLEFDTSMSFSADPSTAGPGMKDENDISLWTCVPSNNLGPKFDLRQAYLGFYREPHDPPENHLLMFGGGIRDSNNGSVAIGFWLFNSEVACDFDVLSPTYGKFIHPDGTVASHEVGDALLVSDFTAGGRVYNIHAWQWQCVDPNDLKTCGPEELDLSVLGPDYVYGDCKSSLTDEPGEMLMCGTVNEENQSPITLAWDPRSTLKNSMPYELQTGQFFEGGVDLTELTGFGEDRCVSSFVLETRSSHKIDAKLHDFIGGRLSTCGTIIVRKITDPTPDTTLFDFNVNDGDGYSYDFSLADAGEEIIGSVLPGTYAVSELTEPASWTLYAAQCGRDTDGDGLADSGFFDPRDQDVEVGLSEVYVCTFWNVKDATLKVIKACDPVDDNGLFNLLIDGSGSTDSACGGEYGPEVVSIGAHTVSESAGTDTSLDDYFTPVITGDCASDGSVSLAAGEHKTCTITNTRRPTLKVIKACDPVDDNGLFNLLIDGSGSTDTACGGEYGPEFVSIGAHTVSESAGTGTDLSAYFAPVITGDCAADGSVTLAAGDHKTCTITNTRRPTNYETAYAMGLDNTCFDELGANNWGWVNGNGATSIVPGSYTWPVWAGAAQCDTGNGTLVGTVNVVYDGTDVFVTWNIYPQYVLDATHVYAGYDQVPPGGFAPGQYAIYGPFNDEPIFIIAHAIVGVTQ